jgi:hypothetical protein
LLLAFLQQHLPHIPHHNAVLEVIAFRKFPCALSATPSPWTSSTNINA